MGNRSVVKEYFGGNELNLGWARLQRACCRDNRKCSFVTVV